MGTDIKPVFGCPRYAWYFGGAVRYWEVSVADHPVLLLGPVAVHPTRQGEGLGGLLMNESLARQSG